MTPWRRLKPGSKQRTKQRKPEKHANRKKTSRASISSNCGKLTSTALIRPNKNQTETRPPQTAPTQARQPERHSFTKLGVRIVPALLWAITSLILLSTVRPTQANSQPRTNDFTPHIDRTDHGLFLNNIGKSSAKHLLWSEIYELDINNILNKTIELHSTANCSAQPPQRRLQHKIPDIIDYIDRHRNFSLCLNLNSSNLLIKTLKQDLVQEQAELSRFVETRIRSYDPEIQDRHERSESFNLITAAGSLFGSFVSLTNLKHSRFIKQRIQQLSAQIDNLQQNQNMIADAYNSNTEIVDKKLSTLYDSFNDILRKLSISQSSIVDIEISQSRHFYRQMTSLIHYLEIKQTIAQVRSSLRELLSQDFKLTRLINHDMLKNSINSINTKLSNQSSPYQVDNVPFETLIKNLKFSMTRTGSNKIHFIVNFPLTKPKDEGFLYELIRTPIRLNNESNSLINIELEDYTHMLLLPKRGELAMIKRNQIKNHRFPEDLTLQPTSGHCMYYIFQDDREMIKRTCPYSVKVHSQLNPSIQHLTGKFFHGQNLQSDMIIKCRNENDTILKPISDSLLIIPQKCSIRTSNFYIPARNQLHDLTSSHHMIEEIPLRSATAIQLLYNITAEQLQQLENENPNLEYFQDERLASILSEHTDTKVSLKTISNKMKQQGIGDNLFPSMEHIIYVLIAVNAAIIMIAIIILSSQATKTMCATLFLEKVPKNVKCFTLELPNELTINREQIEHCEATRMAMYIIAGAIVAFATIIIIYCIYDHCKKQYEHNLIQLNLSSNKNSISVPLISQVNDAVNTHVSASRYPTNFTVIKEGCNFYLTFDRGDLSIEDLHGGVEYNFSSKLPISLTKAIKLRKILDDHSPKRLILNFLAISEDNHYIRLKICTKFCRCHWKPVTGNLKFDFTPTPQTIPPQLLSARYLKNRIIEPGTQTEFEMINENTNIDNDYDTIDSSDLHQQDAPITIVDSPDVQRT